ncbi:MAG: carbohydrate porin [Motiliproteus sp.]
MIQRPLILAVVMLAASSSQVSVAEENKTTGFGGPEAVDNRIAKDKTDRDLPLKDQLAADGISLAVDYSAVALNANESLPGADDSAAGGMVRFYGSWELLNRGETNVGSFIWKLEHRHAYSDTSVNNLIFGTGGLGMTTPPFSDQKGRLTNLYWKQRFNDGQSTVVAGFLDATDYVDVYAVASPWTGFMNFAFSTGTTTMALPGDATLGAAAATLLGDQFFVIGGIVDMESDPTEPLDGFDTFFSDGHYFKTLELGWTASQEQIYVDNIHITLWDSDRSVQMNQAEDSGVNISASKMYGAWLPFVRAGVADNGSLLGIDKSLSTGFAYYGLGNAANNLGVAINWADANADDDQLTLEAFYFIKVLPYLELTPDLQIIKNPVSNPAEDTIVIAGIRARIVY